MTDIRTASDAPLVFKSPRQECISKGYDRYHSRPMEALEKGPGRINAPTAFPNRPNSLWEHKSYSPISRASRERTVGATIGVAHAHTMINNTNEDDSVSTQQTIQQFTDQNPFEISKIELISELHRLADELGQRPTKRDMEDTGRYAENTYRERFGSWGAALKAAGYDYGSGEVKNGETSHYEISEAELISELRRIEAEVEGKPTTYEMDDFGKYCAETYRNRFGSWNQALEEAGIGAKDQRVSTGALIDDIIDVTVEVGRPPYGRELTELGAHSETTCKSRFGSWAEALRFSGLPARYRGGTSLGQTNSVNEYGDNWRSMRNKALSRDTYTCQHCGLAYEEAREEYGAGLHVHHIYPIRAFEIPEDANFLENLISLCEECHQKWESIGPSEQEIESGVRELEAERRCSNDGI